MHFNKQKRQHYDIHVGGCQNADLRFWFMLSTHRRINKIFVWKLHRYKPYNLHNGFFLSQNDDCEAADPRLCFFYWPSARSQAVLSQIARQMSLLRREKEEPANSDKASSPPLPPELCIKTSFASAARPQKPAWLLILPLSPRPPGMQILKWYSVQCSAPQSGIEMICGSAVD